MDTKGCDSLLVPDASSTNLQLMRLQHLSIIYFNAHSLGPKFDELCVLVETYMPDILCVVETWQSSDIKARPN